jgi:uncharacterized protein YggE
MKFSTSILYISLLSLFSIIVSADTIQRTIITSGQGKVSVMPDLAELNMQLQATNKDGNKAKQEVDEQFNRLLRGLARLGIPKGDVIAPNLQLAPHYDYTSQKRKLMGYRAIRNITVLINNLEQLDQVMNTGLNEGIDQMGNINLKVANEISYKTQARQRAIDQSKSIARELARAYDARLGPIVKINYQGSDVQYPRSLIKGQQSAAMMSDSEPGIYLHDNITFNDQINVVFELLVQK